MPEQASFEEKIAALPSDNEHVTLQELYRLARDARNAGDHKLAQQYLVYEASYLEKNWEWRGWDWERDNNSPKFVYFEKSMRANIESAISAGDFDDALSYIKYGENTAKLLCDDEWNEWVQLHHKQMRQISFDSGRYDDFDYFNRCLLEHQHPDSPEYYEYMLHCHKFNQKMIEIGDYETAYKAATEFRDRLIQDVVNDDENYNSGNNPSAETWHDFIRTAENIQKKCLNVAVEQNNYKLAAICLRDIELQDSQYLAPAEKMLDVATEQNDLEYMFRLSGMKMYFTDWNSDHLYTDKQVQEYLQSQGMSPQPG